MSEESLLLLHSCIAILIQPEYSDNVAVDVVLDVLNDNIEEELDSLALSDDPFDLNTDPDVTGITTKTYN